MRSLMSGVSFVSFQEPIWNIFQCFFSIQLFNRWGVRRKCSGPWSLGSQIFHHTPHLQQTCSVWQWQDSSPPGCWFDAPRRACWWGAVSCGSLRLRGLRTEGCTVSAADTAAVMSWYSTESRRCAWRARLGHGSMNFLAWGGIEAAGGSSAGAASQEGLV